METQYRVVELFGKFSIQKYSPLHKRKFIFWEYSAGGFWYDINKWGNQYNPAMGAYDTLMESFDKLDDAKAKIESLKRGKVIHEFA